MRLPRLPIGLVVPALLVGLVALLATVQYQWLGKVSEAEREQLRRSLDRRAREFADDFDGEITRIYLSLSLQASAVQAGDWSAFSSSLDRWRNAARFPRLIRGIYLIEATGERRTIRAFDTATKAFGPAAEAWPPHLEPVRSQLAARILRQASGPEGKPQILAVTVTPVLAGLPAVLIPVSNGPPLTAASLKEPGVGVLGLQWPGAYVLAEIDSDYLRQTVLPGLVSRHFPEQSPDAYRVAILSAAGSRVFSRGIAAGGSIDPENADVVMPFFSLRPDLVRDLMPQVDTLTYRASPGPGAAGQARADAGDHQQVAVVVEHRSDTLTAAPGLRSAQFRIVRPAWRLVLRHPAGSLDAAVSLARQRNLWIGFGILGVLVAGVALVVGNARRSSQLAARQMDFVATVSHELRTPLTVIRSAAQNLAAGVVSDPAQARRYGALIEDEGRRLTEMVEEVLEYAGIRSGRPRERRPVDVRRLLDDIVLACAPLCEQEGVTLELTAPDDLPPVMGDFTGLRRALQNVVTNALKHAREGRWVNVTAGVARARSGEEIRIAVTDRGAGIDPADLPHVFEPFYRGRRAIERQVHGNGLGLSLVKGVVEGHGGSVTVKSAAGQGTVFTLHLPAAPRIAAETIA